MGRSAGFFKKLKNVGSKIGHGLSKAANWANSNIVQPFKPLISQAIDKLDKTGVASAVFDATTDAYDQHLQNKGTKMKRNETLAKGIELGTNIYNNVREKRYNKAFEEEQEMNGEEW